jgi:hypothetical protein
LQRYFFLKIAVFVKGKEEKIKIKSERDVVRSKMATASKTDADAEKKRKLEKVKKEILAILQSAAKTGRTPEDMDKDYR